MNENPPQQEELTPQPPDRDEPEPAADGRRMPFVSRWPKAPVIILTVAIALIIATGAIYVGLKATSSPSVPRSGSEAVQWAVPAGVLPANEEEQLRNAFLASRVPAEAVLGGAILKISQGRIDGDAGVFYGELWETTDTPVGTEPLVFLVTRAAGDWKIVARSDEAFCPTLQQLPDTLLSPTEKGYFVACAQ